MRIVCAITARWNSKRLPGKALRKIQGKPLIRHIVDKARLSMVDEVVVATTLNSQSIISYCQRNNIAWYAYQNDWDVLSRLQELVASYKADVLVYLWGDCPFIDPNRLDDAINYFLKSKKYFFDMSIPVAIMKTDLLWEVEKVKLSRHKREYIHEYMLKNCDRPFEINIKEDLEKANATYI